MRERQRSEFYLSQERTLLANERTLLAYIRTSLSAFLLAFALLKFFNDDASKKLGLLFLFFGFVFFILGIFYFVSRKKLIFQSVFFKPKK